MTNIIKGEHNARSKEIGNYTVRIWHELDGEDWVSIGEVFKTSDPDMGASLGYAMNEGQLYDCGPRMTERVIILSDKTIEKMEDFAYNNGW